MALIISQVFTLFFLCIAYPNLVTEGVMKSALLYWPMDDKDDLKCVITRSWAIGKDAQNVRGILNGAISFNGTGNAVKLNTNTKISASSCLYNPSACTKSNTITVSMWIKFYHKSSMQETSVLDISTVTHNNRIYSFSAGVNIAHFS